MDENTMTLKDFIEYAEVYPYTQDRYMIEKMIMELGLMELHMESYQFLLEQGGLSLSQLDVLMVESGVHDMSSSTERLYCEKSNAIFSGIKKILNIIVKALKTLFTNIGRVFVKTNEDLGSLDDKCIELARKIKETEWMKVLIKQETDELKNILTPVMDNIDKLINSDGGKLLPTDLDDKETDVFTIISAVNLISNAKFTPGNIKAYAAFCSNSYYVKGLSVMPQLNSLITEIKNMISVIPDVATKEDAIKLKKVAEKAKEDLIASRKSNTKFKFGVEMLRENLKAIEDLSAVIVMAEAKAQNQAIADEFKSVHDAIIAFQLVSADITKSLTEHNNVRSQVVAVHHKIIEKMSAIVAKQA